MIDSKRERRPAIAEQDVLEFKAGDLDLDRPWLFWSSAPHRGLVAHLRQFGQLEPVLVFQQRHWQVLHGCKRVLACLELGQRVRAIPVAPPEGEAAAGLLYLGANLGQEIDDTQRVTCLRYFQSRLSLAKIGEQVLPLLGLNPRGRPGKSLLAWLDLDPAWDTCLAQGHLPLEAASALSRFEARDQEALLPLFKELSWSKNNALRLLTLAWEIGCREGLDLESLFRELGVGELLQRELSPKDCLQLILGTLNARRYPHLVSLQQRAQGLVRQIGRGTVWNIDYDHQFEAPRVRLSSQVNNQADLLQAASSIQELTKDPGWEPFWGLLQGESEDG